MTPEEAARYIVKKLVAEQVNDVVVQGTEHNSQQVKFSNNLVNAIKTLEVNSVSIFAVKDKRVVATALRNLNKSAADQLIKNMLSFMSSAPENEGYGGIAKSPFNYKEIKRVYDPSVEEDGEVGVNIVDKAITRATEQGMQRSAGIFEVSSDNIFIKTSQGVEAWDKGTKLYFSIRCFAEKDASGHMVAASRDLNGFDVNGAVDKAASIAHLAKNPKPIASGTYDVLFEHLSFANIVDRVGMASSAFAVEAGLSFLADKIGTNVASPLFRLEDTGVLPNGYDSIKFDEEGAPTKSKAIIEDGILKTYLHNTSTAKRYNTKTTGNAGLVSPSPLNLVVSPGKKSFDELVSEVKKGLYVTNVWYTRFQNYHSGDFSTIPRDGVILIEDGQLKHAVRDTRISDNMLNVLKSIRALGKDSKQVFGWEVETPVITPMALATDLKITRSED